MGWPDPFRFPRYGGPGGLPINIEYIVRQLEKSFGDKIDWYETAQAAFSLRSCMDGIEDYWERGPGGQAPTLAGINHNLAIYGWDLRDALSRTSAVCASAIGVPKDDWIDQVVENANDRAALRVLPPALPDRPNVSMLDAAEALGKDGGIETLIVFLGSNNALGTVVNLKVMWTKEGDGKAYQDLVKKKQFNVWAPPHFQVELDALVARVKDINAQRVIWATVPHVTVAPVSRGVGGKVAKGSRYFPFYTRPWISNDAFDPLDDPRITAAQARAIDSAIDQYNDLIVGAVKAARVNGSSWFVLDIAGVLDRLAYRRYLNDPEARPDWWQPYELPAALKVLTPVPDSRFFVSDPQGRKQGGLFSLDGVHPTTIAYGIIAQEFLNVMSVAGIPAFRGDGKTIRREPVVVDFKRLIALDTLMSDPPRSLSSDLGLIGWLDQKVDLLKRLL
jgi:hypothetical protein